MRSYQHLIFFAIVILVPKAAFSFADLVVVYKSKKTLHLMSNNKVTYTFAVVFGNDPIGHKEQEGDERTPEGSYILDYKNAQSGYFKSIHISYPNEEDKMKAKSRGLQPGGNVMIHGQKNGFGWLSVVTQLFNWTNGCIALANKDMQIVWDEVKPGTPIQIYP